MRRVGILAPHILNRGTLCSFTLQGCAQVGPSGSLDLSEKRIIFHREILFIRYLNLYGAFYNVLRDCKHL
jgi:hypothetical protein